MLTKISCCAIGSAEGGDLTLRYSSVREIASIEHAVLPALQKRPLSDRKHVWVDFADEK